MQAIVNGNEACLKLLLDAGYSPSSGIDGGLVHSPIFVAMTKDSFGMTYLLLTHGLDLRSDAVIQSMFFAASNKKNEALRAFLSAGVLTDTTDRDGQTALMGAAAIGDAESVRILLAAGADPNARSNSGLTSFMMVQGDEAKFQLLLGAAAQYPQTLIPLHSTRADVERIAKLTSASGDEVEFETDEEVLDLKFASSPCDRNGWNVPKATVISYRSTPKKYLQIQTYRKSDSTIIHGTDSGRQIISFIKRGMHVTTTADLEHVDHVLFTPRPEDASFRCTGFPEYSPLNLVSSPAQAITIKSVEKWDPGVLATPVFWVKEQNIRLQIFAYCEKNKPQQCEKLRERVLLLKRHLSASELQRFSVEIGGFRDKAEIEVFALPADAPQLTPQPYYPSPWFYREPQNCFSAPEVRNKDAVSPCVLAKITKELGQDQIVEALYPASRMGKEIIAFGIQICSQEDLSPSLRQSIVDPAEIYDRIRFVYPSRQPAIFIRSAECDGESSGPKYSLRVVAFTTQSSIETWKDRVDAKIVISKVHSCSD
ncbi:MAG TPA: ankyrin repeat domain-containing protein [Pyrinomonadaceae bacterium]|nr:ankyrin repeat domain-containing protein [Pyrinomonadaceae bacterium]